MINEGMGKRIKDLRKERNITREQLADKVGITIKFLYEVENDKKGVSAEILLKIATILSAAMMLRYTFNLSAEADAIEAAVKQVLADGVRTGDIAKPGEKVYGTVETGKLIAEAIK